MPADGSVTLWINDLKTGDPAAAKRLWDRYYRGMLTLARRRLRDLRAGVGDEEDVALSAFDSFCRAAEGGRFPRVNDRDSLWHLLITITSRKAMNFLTREQCEKRGGEAGRVTSLRPDSVASHEMPPDLAAEVSEEFRRLIDRLDDPVLQSVALLRLEGYSNEEIADRLGCVPRSVERKFGVIRRIWGEGEAEQ